MENNNWLKIENGVLRHCSQDAMGEIVIPNSVTSIGESAFYGCTCLTSIEIPNSVTSIGMRAFCGCSDLKSINIPRGVTSIGECAFSYCTSLTSIEIPSSVTSIGKYAFKYCTGLTSITIPNSVTSIGYSAFEGCSGLSSITIPNSVTSIGEYVFYNCTSLYHYPKNGERVIAYKGFDCKYDKLMCRGKVYSLTELNTESEVQICEHGIHACLLPIEVLSYYDTDYIYKVEMSGKFDYEQYNSKICSTEMRILEKIKKDDLVKETIKVLNNLKTY